MTQKHIHIIGIAGVATSAIAIAFHKAGWKVSGSDKGFFSPVSDTLSEVGISFYAGWHGDKMIESGIPNIVMIGGSGKSSVNPEMLLAKEKNIPIYSYPQIIEKYFLRKNSIVCAGTWGKTTASALLSFIFEEAGKDPTYMFGGISLSQKESARLSETDWNILEGDEYTGAQFDEMAKFLHYHPTHLLLTALYWDHADVYPTEQSYFKSFETLIEKMPVNSLIVALRDNPKVMELVQKMRQTKTVVTYGTSEGSYQYQNVSAGKNGIFFTIIHNGKKYAVRSSLLGAFQAENITGCFALASEIGIEKEKIIESITKFKGIRRRLEKRHEGKVTILDDIAHSPEKAGSVLSALKEIWTGNIFAVFEPNLGARERSTIPKYEDAFKDALEVIIPRLSSTKLKSQGDMPMEGDELAKVVSASHKNCLYIEDDEKLTAHLISNTKPGDCIVFLGSHSFRGMIPELIKKLDSTL